MTNSYSTFMLLRNLPNPFQNDLVSHVKSAIDDKNVLQLVLDGDQGLMRHVILVERPKRIDCRGSQTSPAVG